MIRYFGLPRHDENNFLDGCCLDAISENVLRICNLLYFSHEVTFVLDTQPQTSDDSFHIPVQRIQYALSATRQDSDRLFLPIMHVFH